MPLAFHSRRHDSKIQRPITFFRNLIVSNAPPSFVKFPAATASLIRTSVLSTPINDQVPDEIYAHPSASGAAATALAVSCVAGATTRISPRPVLPDISGLR